MVGSTKEVGRTIRCTVRACTAGLMGSIMTVTTSMTRRKDKEFSFGQMDADIMVVGKTVSSTEKEYITQAMV